MLFSFGLLVFGSLSVIEILKNEFQNYFSKNTLTKIGTSSLCVIFFIVFVVEQSLVRRSLTVFCGLLVLYVCLRFHLRILEQKMINEAHCYLKNILLQMKLGVSLRRSMEHSLQYETSIYMRTWLLKIYDNVVFTQHKTEHFRSQTLVKLISELRIADENPQTAFARLENLYFWLKTLSDFRRKSGKVLSQVRLQAVITGVIYIALVLFIQRFVEWKYLIQVLPWSLLLMIGGLISSFYLGRKMKWKL